MPIFEITDENDSSTFMKQLEYMIFSGRDLGTVPIAKNIDEKTLAALEGANKIGIKLKQFSQVLAIVDSPFIAGKQLSATSVTLTSGIRNTPL